MEKSNINICVIDRQGRENYLDVPVDMGLNLMEVVKSYDLPVDGTCGGMALCASCHVYIVNGSLAGEIDDAEQAMLDDTPAAGVSSRLGCQIPVTSSLNGLVVKLAPEDSY